VVVGFERQVPALPRDDQPFGNTGARLERRPRPLHDHAAHVGRSGVRLRLNRDFVLGLIAGVGVVPRELLATIR